MDDRERDREHARENVKRLTKCKLIIVIIPSVLAVHTSLNDEETKPKSSSTRFARLLRHFFSLLRVVCKILWSMFMKFPWMRVVRFSEKYEALKSFANEGEAQFSSWRLKSMPL